MSKSVEFKVCVRKRPTNDTTDVVSTSSTTVTVKTEKVKANLEKYIEHKVFEFDKVYSEYDKTRKIYSESICSHIEEKKNFICYTFGETGSGKTHTLFGPEGLIDSTLFELTNLHENILIGSYEIYNDQIFDLLNKKTKVMMLESEGNINIPHLTWRLCNYNTMNSTIDCIKKARSVGISSENSESSRSHCIVHMKIKNLNYIFVDLAGSERSRKSKYSSKKNHSEMANINMDIFNLKECIRMSKENKNRIPFRSSKLTMALRESFFDQYSSLMIVTISPEKSNTVETINILSHALMLSSMKRKSKINLPKNIPILPEIKKNKNLQILPNISNITTEAKSKILKKNESCVKLPQIKENIENVKKSENKIKKTDKLLGLINEASNECVVYSKLTEKDQDRCSEHFGQIMAVILTDQVGVLRNIDKKFGRKFFALS